MATKMMPGGFSDPQPATQDIQEIVCKVKPQFEQMTNETYGCFRAVIYRAQVVAGMNYLVKVHLGNDSYAHLKIFVPLPVINQPPILTAYQIPKTKDDPLIPF
ncbi:cystatin-A-like [Notamacropus eugenii]|uniref:cystatin-A-like n=1 Tax=Notamacropus eugenii TaxID=9315 RepID=UPI003B681329